MSKNNPSQSGACVSEGEKISGIQLHIVINTLKRTVLCKWQNILKEEDHIVDIVFI